MSNKKPHVTLIGAGPGDPDLLTIKGAKALAKADIILYDALVNPSLLELAPQAEKLFVGKRRGCHAYSQNEINELIVSSAYTYGHVVRLKGGDPFVFGRGSEEISYCENFGIETTVIPGITSAIAVPASQGISITQRGVSESFWVITGTTSDHQLSKDVALAAQSSATVVILMGMSKLSEIVSLYKRNRTDNLPVAIIQDGTKEEEKCGYGTIETIEEVVKEKKLANPAIIVIGDVVKNATKLQEYFEEIFYEDEFLFQNLNLTPFSKS
ncbi:MAG: uroporphyrinogen-III C-methyltransferase [Flavobacteriales bacterium]|nr:uroporphyrinogen-III C-methyltransferase [Flavobacteriales bacterium]